MNILKKIAHSLVVVGALNWGLVGLFNFNLVETALGSVPTIERLVYVLVGVSALLLVVTRCGKCRACDCSTCK